MTTIPPVPPASHEEIAAAMMIQIRELAQSVSGFTFSAKGRRRKITPAASVPDPFLEAVAVACDASPHLGVASQVTTAELRDTITFSRAFTSVANELMVVARGFLDTVAERRNQVGQRALRAYSMAKSINRPEDRELLIPHLANMQRTLGRGRKRVAATPPAPPAPPAQKTT